jgi:hypothetical protein
VTAGAIIAAKMKTHSMGARSFQRWVAGKATQICAVPIKASCVIPGTNLLHGMPPDTDKRRVLANDLDVRRQENEQRKASTYFAFGALEADEPRGRFAAINETTIVGSSPLPTYPQLPSGPWSGPDMLPPEPPLGYEIHAVAPLDPEPLTVSIPVEATGDPACSDPSPKGCAPCPDAADVERGAGSPFSREEGDGA